jgi:hypothetical protein
VNGSVNETLIPITTAGGSPQGFVIKNLSATQYVQLQTWQNSGSDQTVDSDSWFSIEFLGT